MKNASVGNEQIRKLNRLVVTSIIGALIWIIGYILAATRLYRINSSYIAVYAQQHNYFTDYMAG